MAWLVVDRGSAGRLLRSKNGLRLDSEPWLTRYPPITSAPRALIAAPS